MINPIPVSILVLTVTGAALTEHAYWGYALSTPLLVAKNHDLEAVGLLAIAFIQTFSWPFWIATAIVFSTSIGEIDTREETLGTTQDIPLEPMLSSLGDLNRTPLSRSSEPPI